MKKSIISMFIALLGFGMVSTSCDDMLTPNMNRYATEFSGKDTVHFYIGILRNLQQVTEQNILLGELRGDLLSTTDYVTDSIAEIANFKNPENEDCALLNRAAYYKVINQCNYYLAKSDTLSRRNNYYYMRKETAQVLLIRAWTYMQLVQTYGRVPFITKPVTSSTTGWETNPEEGWATPDNLLSLLKNDMDQAWLYCKTQGYPNYSNTSDFNTGYVSINHRLMNFDADVVYGDLYLLCGKTTADFEQAAEHYYNFLYDKDNRTNNTVSGSANVNEDNKTSGEPIYTVSNKSWKGDASNVSYNFGGNEIITGVPSASNSNFGLSLTRIPNIFGFDIHSTNSTDTEYGAGDSGEDVSTTTGYVSLAENYRVRQMEPSKAWERLNEAQTIFYFNKQATDLTDELNSVAYPKGKYDARMNPSAPIVATEKGKMRFVAKFGGAGNIRDNGEARNFSFRYMIPLYRYRTIMLHYAEAVNRAGFPAHAFAIVRDGLDATTYPVVDEDYALNLVDTTATPIFATNALETGNDGYFAPDAADYIPVDELRRAESKLWLYGIHNTSVTQHGVHEAGCGTVTELDTIFSYNTVVTQRIVDELTRTEGAAAARRYLKHRAEEAEADSTITREVEQIVDNEDGTKDTIYVDVNFKVLPAVAPAQADSKEMMAVELFIADELALESAFEGNRFNDLTRIARHLNNFEGGNYGTEWLAWKIARRAQDLAPYEEPNTYDGALYNLLLNEENWYMQNPKY